jgi:hypothetical protein
LVQVSAGRAAPLAAVGLPDAPRPLQPRYDHACICVVVMRPEQADVRPGHGTVSHAASRCSFTCRPCQVSRRPSSQARKANTAQSSCRLCHPAAESWAPARRMHSPPPRCRPPQATARGRDAALCTCKRSIQGRSQKIVRCSRVWRSHGDGVLKPTSCKPLRVNTPQEIYTVAAKMTSPSAPKRSPHAHVPAPHFVHSSQRAGGHLAQDVSHKISATHGCPTLPSLDLRVLPL